jgi:hypothetical protein
MHYRYLAAIVLFLFMFLLIGLMAVPTAGFFLFASALTPILLGILVIGILQSPAASDARAPRSEADWYDQP